MNGSEKNILPKGGGERGMNIQLSKERNRIASTPALFDNAKRGKEYRKYGKSMTDAKRNPTARTFAYAKSRYSLR